MANSWVIVETGYACTNFGEGGGSQESQQFLFDVTLNVADNGINGTIEVVIDGSTATFIDVNQGDTFQYGTNQELSDGVHVFDFFDFLDSSLVYTVEITVNNSLCSVAVSVDIPRLHIPYKKWAFISSEHTSQTEINQHKANWAAVERWASRLSCPSNDFWGKSLRIPYKLSFTPEQSESNYLQFERWAKRICPWVHIPYKKWAFPETNNPNQEENNLVTIERWSRAIDRCCEGAPCAWALSFGDGNTVTLGAQSEWVATLPVTFSSFDVSGTLSVGSPPYTLVFEVYIDFVFTTTWTFGPFTDENLTGTFAVTPLPVTTGQTVTVVFISGQSGQIVLTHTFPDCDTPNVIVPFVNPE